MAGYLRVMRFKGVSWIGAGHIPSVLLQRTHSFAISTSKKRELAWCVEDRVLDIGLRRPEFKSQLSPVSSLGGGNYSLNSLPTLKTSITVSP